MENLLDTREMFRWRWESASSGFVKRKLLSENRVDRQTAGRHYRREGLPLHRSSGQMRTRSNHKENAVRGSSVFFRVG